MQVLIITRFGIKGCCSVSSLQPISVSIEPISALGQTRTSPPCPLMTKADIDHLQRGAAAIP